LTCPQNANGNVEHPAEGNEKPVKDGSFFFEHGRDHGHAHGLQYKRCREHAEACRTNGEHVSGPGGAKKDDAERVLRDQPERGGGEHNEQRENELVAHMDFGTVGLVERNEARRNKVHHESRGEDDQFVCKVVGSQEFGRGKVRGGVEPYGEVGEACQARHGVGERRLEHECKKAPGFPGEESRWK